MAAASLLIVEDTANAAIVPTVPLGTSADFSVLGRETVTNTGDTVLDGSVGVWAGTAIVGFPPGIVQAPGTIEAATPVAQDAQADSTAAYLNAEGRPINATLTNDLSGLTLVGGVFEGPSQGPLSLTGTLTLDGEGDPNSVFIFQKDSTLITGSGSVASLINGAQECNVFWQVGSSATLGTGSTFVGNILALTTISLDANVTVHGRALAQTGEVTLIDDTFTQPLCDLSAPTTTTAAGGATNHHFRRRWRRYQHNWATHRATNYRDLGGNCAHRRGHSPHPRCGRHPPQPSLQTMSPGTPRRLPHRFW